MPIVIFRKTTTRNFRTRLHGIYDASARRGGFSDNLFGMKTPVKEALAILARPRVYIGDDIAIGPGKIDLLRAVGETRSITAAARSLGLPYKRAWLLIDSLNVGFEHPVVVTATGGKGGGGASLTTLGQELVAAYDALEKRLDIEAAPELEALRKLADRSRS